MNSRNIFPQLVLSLALLLSTWGASAQTQSIQPTIDSLNLVIHHHPADPFPVYEKAKLFYTSGSLVEAFRFFKQVTEMYTKNPDAAHLTIAADSYYHMAVLSINTAKPKAEAHGYAEAAIKLMPKEKGYRIMQARTLATLPGKRNEAENQFESLVKEYPTDAEVLLEYALYIEDSSPERAAKMFEKVLRNNPTDARSLFALGNYEIKKGLKEKKADISITHYHKAEGYLVAALQQEPQNDAYRKTLGDLYSNLMWYYKGKNTPKDNATKEQYQQKAKDLGVKQ